MEDKKETEPVAEFDKLVSTPLTEAEAQKTIGDIDIQVAQLHVIRQSLLNKLGDVDLQLAQSAFDRTIVVKRALLGVEKKD